MPVWCLVTVSLRFIRSYVITLRKSRWRIILGTVSCVKASMSRVRPGTAADSILLGKTVRNSLRRRGYAAISHALSAFGTSL